MLWGWFVETLRTAIFMASQVCGGNVAGGILIVTACVRLALLPLTLRMAKLSAAHQQALASLKPELNRLRRRYHEQPERLSRETQRLFAREGVKPLPLASCFGGLAQMPIFVALFAAVRKCAALGGRFLWIRNIAQPDGLLAVLVALLTCLSVAVTRNTPEQGRAAMIVLPMILALIALWQLSAGIALYWGVSSAFALTQSVVIRWSSRAQSRA